MNSTRRVPAIGLLAAALASVIACACGACGPETTSFRPTESVAAAIQSGRPGPPAAAYDVRMDDQPIAEVRVWSIGGYISVSDQAMTQIGFEIHNTGTAPIIFDSDVLALTVFDHTGGVLPVPLKTSVEPTGGAQRPIKPGTTLLIGAYFELPVQPRAVETMQVQWALRAVDQRYLQITRFARDDDGPIIAPHPIETAPHEVVIGRKPFACQSAPDTQPCSP